MGRSAAAAGPGAAEGPGHGPLDHRQARRIFTASDSDHNYALRIYHCRLLARAAGLRSWHAAGASRTRPENLQYRDCPYNHDGGGEPVWRCQFGAARRRCDGSAVFPKLSLSIDVPLAVVRASAPRPQFAMSRVSVEVHGAASA